MYHYSIVYFCFQLHLIFLDFFKTFAHIFLNCRKTSHKTQSVYTLKYKYLFKTYVDFKFFSAYVIYFPFCSLLLIFPSQSFSQWRSGKGSACTDTHTHAHRLLLWACDFKFCCICEGVLASVVQWIQCIAMPAQTPH